MNTNHKPYWLPIAAILVLSAPSVLAADGDIAKGEEKSQVCIACHGEEGISVQDNYPHLRGQRQTYLLRQMRTFRDGGDRRDPIMTPMLENMSDQDLKNLAAYYSSFGNVLGSGAQSTQPDTAPMASPEIKGRAVATPTGPDKTVAAAAAPAGAGDAASGQTKSAACAACHGADGRGTTPLFPNLNGQKPEYLMVQLKAFRDGKRTDPTMAPMATALTDQDVADLAAFYGGLQPAPAPAAAGSGDAASGKTKSAACAACHGADGRGTTPLFPNLNGQKPEYLMVQLKAFRDGKRADETMAPMAMALTDQDIANLAAFYGRLK